jgi:hypothetical protein
MAYHDFQTLLECDRAVLLSTALVTVTECPTRAGGRNALVCTGNLTGKKDHANGCDDLYQVVRGHVPHGDSGRVGDKSTVTVTVTVCYVDPEFGLVTVLSQNCHRGTDSVGQTLGYRDRRRSTTRRDRISGLFSQVIKEFSH